jgi:hypothetical protein
MSDPLADNISPALMAALDQATVDLLAMVSIYRDGTLEMHARSNICRPSVAAALRRLADEVEQG